MDVSHINVRTPGWVSFYKWVQGDGRCQSPWEDWHHWFPREVPGTSPSGTSAWLLGWGEQLFCIALNCVKWSRVFCEVHNQDVSHRHATPHQLVQCFSHHIYVRIWQAIEILPLHHNETYPLGRKTPLKFLFVVQWHRRGFLCRLSCDQSPLMTTPSPKSVDWLLSCSHCAYGAVVE